MIDDRLVSDSLDSGVSSGESPPNQPFDLHNCVLWFLAESLRKHSLTLLRISTVTELSETNLMC